jgi:hypothetical protein
MEAPDTLEPERAALTLMEAAARLDLSRSTTNELAKTDRFPCPIIKAGKRVYVSRVILERLLDPEREQAASRMTAKLKRRGLDSAAFVNETASQRLPGNSTSALINGERR